jgi:hypothetical protein
MRTYAYVTVISCLCALAFADDKAKRDIPPETRKQYAAAMKSGQKLSKKGDLPGALAAFKQALALVSEDARALSELGVVAQKQHDLAAAESYTKRAIAAAGDPSVKGASLYNLGRIAEEKHDNAAAIDAYKRSLEARPHHVVRERLLALDPAAAAALDPFAPRPLDGPFKTIAAWCKKQPKPEIPDEDKAETGDTTSWDCGDFERNSEDKSKAPLALDKPPAPYAAVRLVAVKTGSKCEADDGCPGVEMHLAIKTKEGWFVSKTIEEVDSAFRSSNKLDISSLAVRDVLPGGAPEVVLEYTWKGYSYGGGMETSSESDKLCVAGLGASGRPSVTAAILKRRFSDDAPMSDDSEEKEVKVEYSFELKFLPTGELEVKSGRGKIEMDKAELASFLGKHAIAFP